MNFEEKIMETVHEAEKLAEEAVGVAHKSEVEVDKAFVDVFGEEAAHAFAKGAGAILKSEVAVVAQQACQSLEDVRPALSNEVKRAQAFQQIKDSLVKSGVVVADGLINLLIEIVVQAIKSRILLP